ncbi:MAG: DUF512 domain-containing protein, partial [Eggerthellaceae bacterium]|nr:DUF512 domain-containing protein [Eggerthellaceae bacterium]
RYVVGEAMQPWLDALLAGSALEGRLVPLTVPNAYYGGNVNVTGLLCGCDIAPAVRAAADAASPALGGPVAGPDAAAPRPAPGAPRRPLFLLPRVILNDQGVTLDDMTVQDIEKAAGAPVAVVSCNPSEYLTEIIRIAGERGR